MDLNATSFFVQVVHSGSFVQASKVLNVPKSTLSDKIAELEEDLGVTLLTRTTRKLKLTEAGEAYFKRCEQALNDIHAAHNEASNNQSAPHGLVRLTAPADLAGSSLIDLIAEYQERFPDVKIEIDFSGRVVDLIAEGYDLAIRAGTLPNSSLIAKKAGKDTSVLIASTQYLKKNGTPKHPKELSSHVGLHFTDAETDNIWHLRSNDGKSLKVKVLGNFSSNSIAALKRLVVLHRGIALLPLFLCKKELSEKSLVQILPGWTTGEEPFHLVYPAQRYLPPKIRELIPYLERAIHEASSTRI